MINPTVIRIAKQMIKDNEGFREKIYLDNTGHHTVGYGHSLHFMPVTKRAADVILEDDMQWFIDNLPKHIKIFNELDEARQAVLIDMAFNLGMLGLLRFKKFLNYISNKDFEKAADEMLDSVWAKQVGQRAYNNARIIRTGVMVQQVNNKPEKGVRDEN